MSINIDLVTLFEELEETLQKLKKLKEGQEEIDDEEIPTAFNSDILTDVKEYILMYYGKNRPIWAEAFYQICSWQWSILYEGIEVYYENLYEDNDYKTIMRVGQYLKQNGYPEFYEYYVAPAVEYEEELEECPDGVAYSTWHPYPEEMYPILKKTEEWAEKNLEMVWNFYVDILKKYKSTLLESQKEKL